MLKIQHRYYLGGSSARLNRFHGLPTDIKAYFLSCYKSLIIKRILIWHINQSEIYYINVCIESVVFQFPPETLMSGFRTIVNVDPGIN